MYDYPLIILCYANDAWHLQNDFHALGNDTETPNDNTDRNEIKEITVNVLKLRTPMFLIK